METSGGFLCLFRHPAAAIIAAKATGGAGAAMGPVHLTRGFRPTGGWVVAAKFAKRNSFFYDAEQRSTSHGCCFFLMHTGLQTPCDIHPDDETC